MDRTIDRLPFVLGRHPECDWRLNHPCISRRHCRLFLNGEEVCIQDLESTNGTFGNGQRVDVPQGLREGDRVTLPLFSFQVSNALVLK